MSFLRRACGVLLSRVFAAALAAIPIVALVFVALPAHAGAKRKPAVLVMYGPNTVGASDVQSKLMSSGEFAKVDLYVTSAIPSFATLSAYDAVLLYTTTTFSPPGDELGNVLADYVDAGGGVVSMAYTTTGQYMPPGRFFNQYRVMNLGNVVTGPGSLNTASITNTNHSVLIGVSSLTTGATDNGCSQTSVIAGAEILAKWADGRVLAAAGPRPGRVDLNFSPVSSSFAPGNWNTGTDGLKLMVNGLLRVMRPRVLLLANDDEGRRNNVKTTLRAGDFFNVGPVVGVVDTFDASAGTPTLNQLKQYDAVFVWGATSLLSNPTAMGNVLADYVDGGGGVVTGIYSNTDGGVGYRLGGRWISGGYEVLPAAGTNYYPEDQATLGAVTYPGHPIMAGVSSFAGGAASYRPYAGETNQYGLTVASWSDGAVLVAVSTKFPNRVDLGLYPVSSAVAGDLWQTSSDGAKIMGNALLYVSKPYVGCVSADPTYAGDPVAKLIASRRFSGVAAINVTSSTPALAALSPMSSLLVWSNQSFSSATAMGNVLADYIDAGGGSVTAVFGNTSSPAAPAGRWITQGYEIVPSPLLSAHQSSPPVSLGTIPEPNHPIARFIRKFDGGAGWRLFGTLLRGRSIINWADGSMLASVHTFRKRADLGMWPASNALFSGGWNQRTDGTWLMANALEWTSRSKPCPGDFNGDGVVDDSDFTLFVGYYNTLIDPRGDLTGDALTEDADFSKFVGGYNDLVCP